MHKFLLGISVLLAFASGRAIAEPARSGTSEEQKACARDVERFCRTLMDQGDLTILACLQQNRPKLTVACNQVLKNHNQ
jgi:hypothetical protein